MAETPSATGLRVSVVTAVRGNSGCLPGLLRALAAQNLQGGLEVVLVDNHPRPVLTRRSFHQPGLDLRVVHEAQPGLSRARNRGLAHASGDITLITDPDTRPRPTWAAALVHAMATTGADVAGGRAEPRFTDPDHHRPVSPELLQWFVPPHWPAATTALRAPYWAIGCNLALRRSAGFTFDTRLGVRGRRHLSCEELELTIRAQGDGHHVILVPDAVVDRAIHRRDLRPPAVGARAFWHGVSIARLLQLHPDADIYDSARLRDALAWARLKHITAHPAVLTDLARLSGFRLEQLRHTASRRQRGLNQEPAHA